MFSKEKVGVSVVLLIKRGNALLHEELEWLA
jgi:hypothetical protein